VVLLSRVAERIYWSARWIERGEDTARVVRAFGDVFVDMPVSSFPPEIAWPPLARLGGDQVAPDEAWPDEELGVVRFLVTDRHRPNTVVSCVANARENLRTTREVLPREAWETINDLWLFTEREAGRAVERRQRDRFLARVIDESRRLDGVITVAMTRDAAYEMWRLGRYIERADMTTRVVGVRAAALMAAAPGSELDHDEVHWMGVLRSLTALQMYQRATRGPIEASSVVRFLLYASTFPRSVAGALDEMERSLVQLTRTQRILEALTEARHVLRSATPHADDGADLDLAMERLQLALAHVHDEITLRFLQVEAAT
jgi:uncharacterized alpha-E superfamily protein